MDIKLGYSRHIHPTDRLCYQLFGIGYDRRTCKWLVYNYELSKYAWCREVATDVYCDRHQETADAYRRLKVLTASQAPCYNRY